MSAAAPRGAASRRVFIGDVQGCLDELERLLEAVNFDPARDELHPVGDVVNRGPSSLGVLRLLRSNGAGGVLGNHDLHLLKAARGERPIGPRDTIQEVLEAPDRDELLTWLAERPLVRTWPDVVCVHAAIHPAWSDPQSTLTALDPLGEDAAVAFATRARYCDENGTRPATDWPPPDSPFRPWFELWEARANETRTVVYGHWARMGLVVRPRVRGLDTGCVWGNELTAWIAEEDRLIHIPAARPYSPTTLPPEAFG